MHSCIDGLAKCAKQTNSADDGQESAVLGPGVFAYVSDGGKLGNKSAILAPFRLDSNTGGKNAKPESSEDESDDEERHARALTMNLIINHTNHFKIELSRPIVAPIRRSV